MSLSKLIVGSFTVSILAMVAGCATNVGPEGAGAEGVEGARAEADAVDESAVGKTSSAMTQLALCPAGTDPNARGNLLSVGAFEEYVRSKMWLDWCALGANNRRETIVDFDVSTYPIHNFEFIAAPNIYKAGGPPVPKDPVACSGLRLEASFHKWKADTSSFEPIVAKVVKTGTWVGPLAGGHCEVPTHVFHRTNMVNSTTLGGETNKYRIVTKVEQFGQVTDAYVRGRNLGSGF